MTSQARCARCYEPLREGARFCPKCGNSVEQPSQIAQQSRSNRGSGVECPSCRHRNPVMASYCASCGAQLPDLAAGSAAPVSGSRSDVDPWATGPGYDRSLSVYRTCPRCHSIRNQHESVCTTCGLPFGRQDNYDGVPAAVAMVGEPAGFWARFVAVIVDGIILTIVFYIIGSALGVNLFDTSEPAAGETDPTAVLQLLQFVFSSLYGAIFLSLFGTTPGKKLFNIYVLDGRGNRKLNFFQALGRELSKLISTIILLIGYIMAAFRSDKRALHDLIAGTYPTIRRNLR
ncbi:MAG: RDD family protein [Chloroflexi bacterium]|nr:RDD family protein [Chloroflexota bacterium]